MREQQLKKEFKKSIIYLSLALLLKCMLVPRMQVITECTGITGLYPTLQTIGSLDVIADRKTLVFQTIHAIKYTRVFMYVYHTSLLQ